MAGARPHLPLRRGAGGGGLTSRKFTSASVVCALFWRVSQVWHTHLPRTSLAFLISLHLSTSLTPVWCVIFASLSHTNLVADGESGLRVPAVLVSLWEEMLRRGDEGEPQTPALTLTPAPPSPQPSPVHLLTCSPVAVPGLGSEGIFRLSANHEEVSSVKAALDALDATQLDSKATQTAKRSLATASAQALAALIKLYLRELPDDLWGGLRAQVRPSRAFCRLLPPLPTFCRLLPPSQVDALPLADQDWGSRAAALAADLAAGVEGTGHRAHSGDAGLANALARGSSGGEGGHGPEELHGLAQGLLYQMSPSAADLVVWVCDVMVAVVAREADNRMNIGAVSTVFAPGLVHVPAGCDDPAAFMQVTATCHVSPDLTRAHAATLTTSITATTLVISCDLAGLRALRTAHDASAARPYALAAAVFARGARGGGGGGSAC